MDILEFYNSFLLDIPYEIGLILASVSDVISCIILAFTEMLFVKYLCGEKGKADKKFFCFTSLIFVFNCLNSVILYNCLRLCIGAMFIAYIINITIPLIYLFTAFKHIETIRKIIAPFLYQVIYIFSYIISDIIYISIFPADFTQTLFCQSTEKVLITFSTLIIHSMAVLLILLLYKRTIKSKGKFNILYLTAPFPLFLAIIVILYPLSFDYDDVVRYFCIFYELNSILFMAIIVVALFSALGTYFLLFQMLQKNKVEKEKELYENMLQLEEKRYEDIKASSTQIKKMRHDIKNMLFSVKAELDENNPEQAKEKLDEILNKVTSAGTVINSENRTIDCILNAKLADLENTNVDVSGDVSGLSKIKDVDLSIILGNIIDNAIEATRYIENAEIKISFFIKGNYQNILCENTISQSVLALNPQLKTTKSEKLSHGLGINSVKDVVHSYDGTVNFFENDNKFSVHIMIPIKN